MSSVILSDLVVDIYDKCHHVKKHFQITVNTYTCTRCTFMRGKNE